MKRFKRGLALIMAVCMLLMGTASAEGTGTETALPREEASVPAEESPAETPTAEPQTEATATEAPAQTPEAEATPAAEATPETSPEAAAETSPAATTAAPTEKPWDESLCDHANANCEQAPACLQEGCAHIGYDANGLPYPLCKKGAWILDRQDELIRTGVSVMATERSVRANTIDLSLGDATIYRMEEMSLVQLLTLAETGLN